MGSNEQYIINSIVRVCHKLDAKSFGANHDGNVSVKYGDRIFATPSAVSKGDVSPDMIIILDLSGNKISGYGNPFSELQLHLAAYQARPDISAVVHAHPPYATASGIAGVPLDKPAIPESVVSLGDEIPVSRFAMPGSDENVSIVAEMLQISNAFMMPGNGVLSVGTDVMQAYLRLELVEHLAKINFIARQLGTPTVLSDENIEILLEKRAKAGLAPPAPRRKGEKEKGEGAQSLDADIRAIIEEEVRKALSKLF